MIRCIRIWTGPDGNSLFEEGHIALPHGERGDVLSQVLPAASISFRETGAGGDFPPHHAPTLQLVLTLSGTLEFRTATGATFTVHPGDVLLADDLTGSGHSWRLIDDQPWRRAYVIVGPEVATLFSKGNHHG
jgi:quercetin dioxygenase-like cupin family protein